jgi:hypothetical protein
MNTGLDNIQKQFGNRVLSRKKIFKAQISGANLIILLSLLLPFLLFLLVLVLLLLLLYWRNNPVCFLTSPHGFITVNFSGVRSLAPCLIPNLEDQGLHFWPLPCDLSGTCGPTRSLRFRQHSCPGHWGTQSSSPR